MKKNHKPTGPRWNYSAQEWKGKKRSIDHHHVSGHLKTTCATPRGRELCDTSGEIPNEKFSPPNIIAGAAWRERKEENRQHVRQTRLQFFFAKIIIKNT